MEAVFWISLTVLFYTYIGYGVLLLLVSAFSKKKALYTEEQLQPLTIIVPAYNEEAIIAKKIQNCFSLNYPRHLLSVVIITDGSTDSTPAIVAQYKDILHLHHQERKGKSAALNRAMRLVNTPFVIFTDANAMLHPDSIQKIIPHYRNEKIGGVSGEKRILSTDDTAVGTGERLYWQYESMLKKADAHFYTVIGAAGELFSIRTSLFEPLHEAIILDDFVLSASICLKGYRFAYEQEAYALEASSETIAEEQKRKIRISAGCFQALVMLKALLNPVKNWRLTFQYFSHRVLRWTICPLFVPLLFLSNGFLFFDGDEILYQVFFVLQCFFYLLGFIGWILSGKKGLPKLLFIPYYFIFMNLSLYKGFFLFLANEQPVLWEKAARKTFG